MTEPAGTSGIAPAASVILTRGGTPNEYFVVQRARNLRFMGGFAAFPGGRIGPEDETCPIENGHPAPTLAAAARELFEETGVLLARDSKGHFPSWSPQLDDWRRRLIAGQDEFGRLLMSCRLALRAADFSSVGSLVTPAFAPVRFDTCFYHAWMPEVQRAEVWSGELDSGVWSTTEMLLGAWRRGECLISPPTLLILEAVAEAIPANLVDRLRVFFANACAGVPPVYFTPDVRLIALRTDSLPPNTHTNAYLLGNDPSYLIDPGPEEPDEQDRLFAALDEHLAAGKRLTAVLLTHDHSDHVGAALPVAEKYQLPVWAHAATAQALGARINISRYLAEGVRLPLGPAPDAQGSWELEVLHTPGHAPGHLAFYEARYQLVFAGDLVSTQSSVVIAPPQGDLAAYLQSLRRLQALPARLLFPSHGTPSSRPGQTIEECLKHRAKREAMLLEALGAGLDRVPALAEELYKGVIPGLMRFAELQVAAGLQKLEREGRAASVEAGGEERWHLTEHR